MSTLIDSLLLLARADAGEDDLQREPLDFGGVVREAVELGSPLATERQIGVVADIRPTPVLPGDPQALRRLVYILIDNAIKYSPPNGAVHVSVESGERCVVCTVSDSGIGMSETDQHRIFDRFWRADKVRSRGEGGAGLGLSIAKWIAERHGAKITVTSELGRGTTFAVSLPLAPEV